MLLCIIALAVTIKPVISVKLETYLNGCILRLKAHSYEAEARRIDELDTSYTFGQYWKSLYSFLSQEHYSCTVVRIEYESIRSDLVDLKEEARLKASDIDKENLAINDQEFVNY